MLNVPVGLQIPDECGLTMDEVYEFQCQLRRSRLGEHFAASPRDPSWRSRPSAWAWKLVAKGA